MQHNYRHVVQNGAIDRKTEGSVQSVCRPVLTLASVGSWQRKCVWYHHPHRCTGGSALSGEIIAAEGALDQHRASCHLASSSDKEISSTDLHLHEKTKSYCFLL